MPDDEEPESEPVWWIKYRFSIYLFGLAIWVGLEFGFAASVGPPLGSHETEWTLGAPLMVGIVLLTLNLILTYVRKDHRVKGPRNRGAHAEERGRLTAIQQYGGNVIVAASVVAAITAVQSRFGSLAYLGASIITGVVAIIPIWMPQDDWRPLNLLRHVKTVLLVFSVAWLAQAILVLLSVSLV